jgi:hypothetical protein
MNRLKYRVWITPWGSDTSPYMYYIEDLHLGAAIGNWELGGYKDAVFQQYTGLKDSKGVEIYEGDIVEIGDRKKEVIFNIGMFYIDENYGDIVPISEVDNIIKVIGNIFESPELLKTNE